MRTNVERWLRAVITAGFILATSAHAQPGPNGSADGQSRAARLSSVDGQVQVVVDGQTVADPAYANLPLFEGSQIITRNDGRAEIATDDGSIIRVTPNSTVTLTALSGTQESSKTEVVVNAGQVYFELQPNTESRHLRIDFGRTSVVPNAFSVLRVNFDTEPGVMAIFSGQVHVTRGDSMAVDAHGGQTLSLDPADPSAYNLSDSIQTDSWDQWNTDRDNALQAEQSAATPAEQQLPASETSGMGDLDANGNWYDVPGEGYVWSPYDAQGAGENWDPYGYGYWTSYPGAGYVWVSGYSWGYAPYNCGNWSFYGGFGWGWNPRGGCNPWWHRNRWMANLNHTPGDYQPPARPRSISRGTAQPPHAHPLPPRNPPTIVTAHPLPPVRPIAVRPILVDRRPSSGVNAYLGFQPGQPMVVGGQLVSPVRPIAPRVSYMRSYTYLSGHTPNSVARSLDGGRSAFGSVGTRTPYSHAEPTHLSPTRPIGVGSHFGSRSSHFSGASHASGFHGSGFHSSGVAHGSGGGHP